MRTALRRGVATWLIALLASGCVADNEEFMGDDAGGEGGMGGAGAAGGMGGGGGMGGQGGSPEPEAPEPESPEPESPEPEGPQPEGPEPEGPEPPPEPEPNPAPPEPEPNPAPPEPEPNPAPPEPEPNPAPPEPEPNPAPPEPEPPEPEPEPEPDCEGACARLADCAVEVCDGVGPDGRDDLQVSCEATCAGDPSVINLLSAERCRELVEDVSRASPDFAMACQARPVDRDSDAVPDADDNCPEIPNFDQRDGDDDGRGDVCDNCPETPNFDQADANGNGLGDACEPPVPAGAVRIILNWESPQADLDLHVLHPRGAYGLQPWDIYYDNRSPDWGQPGLAGDATGENGRTETVTLVGLAPGTYTATAAQFRGDTEATITFECGGRTERAGPIRMLEDRGHLWEAFRFNPDGCVFEALDSLIENCRGAECECEDCVLGICARCAGACDPVTGACEAPCGGDCPAGQICDPVIDQCVDANPPVPEGVCGECRRDRNCGNGMRCARDLGVCLPVCGANGECPGDLLCDYEDDRRLYCIPFDFCD